jgi:hypothetical protein
VKKRKSNKKGGKAIKTDIKRQKRINKKKKLT